MGREGRAEGNSALRRLLDEASMSNAALARAVVAAGAREGVHIGTNTTSVRRMLDGSQPRWPVPRLVARVLTRRLHREITVIECGFVDRSPPDDRYDPLRSSGTLDDTVRTVVELSGRDMNRRNFLLGTAFSAAAFSEPALFALTAPPLISTARVGGQRIGATEVEAITATVEHFRRLGNRLGGGLIREQVVRFVHGEANSALHGSYTEQTGRELFSAVAQATRLAGSMAAEVGRHALAQRYYIQAVNLALHVDDRLYAAEVLTHMSRLAVQISQGAEIGQDALHHARYAVALVRTARSVAGSATPILTTQMHAVEARGLALLGDVRETTAAVDSAMRSFDGIRPATEPSWLNYYTQTELYGELGQGLRDIGCGNRAAATIEQALGGYEPWRMRSRAFAQTDLAMTYLSQGEIAGARIAAEKALRIAEPVASRRILDRIRVFHRQLEPYRKHREIAEVDARISALLTRDREPGNET
jgi:tetratricopeptide (TPR) repeat protein